MKDDFLGERVTMPPGMTPASKTRFEMILAVNLGSDARAYPILQMAYHHVLNDVVNGVPIAVTY